MTDRTAMELDGCETAGISLEPEQGAVSKPHWLPVPAQAGRDRARQ